MNRIYIQDLHTHIEKQVVVFGWVAVRRDQGKMIFLDIRDSSGVIQGVVLPNSSAMDTAKELRTEWVISLSGIVHKRPEKNIHTEVENGDIELEIQGIEVLNKTETLPFDISGDTREINEELRLEHRYVDLRSLRMQKNIRARYKVVKHIRDFLDEQGFCEIETPLLTKSTPEGSRDYVVPARLYPGTFYALPQSPQQYKQLLMTAGFEKYFQIAKCMRDEDTRGDRQPEFTQLDMEMSFVDQEIVMQLNEALLISIVQTLYPQKKIQTVPFPRLSYKEAIEKYNSDKPDLREDKNDPNLLAFCWVVDFPFFEKTDTGAWTFTHNPFSRPKPEYIHDLRAQKNIEGILTTQYDVALNGFEIGGGSIRNHNADDLVSVFEIMGYTKEHIQANFGHMLKAFTLGTPPHGGIAWGLDRLLMILQNEPNIREVIPFAKTGEGRDPMMHSPAEITAEQLAELSLRVEKGKK